jgi:hypothetical protein
VSGGPLRFDHAGRLLRRCMPALQVDGVDADIPHLPSLLTELQLTRHGSVRSVLERAHRYDLIVLSRIDLSFNPSMGTARLTELVGLGMPQLRQLVLRGNGLESVAELAAACKALPLVRFDRARL